MTPVCLRQVFRSRSFESKCVGIVSWLTEFVEGSRVVSKPGCVNSLTALQVSEANIARAAAEARQLELERANSQLRLEVAASNATAKSTMEEAVRLLSEFEPAGPACHS
jgi:hypothetical protein